ncbi:hypothetical protein Tco_0844657 [Tanacetum coccineum]
MRQIIVEIFKKVKDAWRISLMNHQPSRLGGCEMTKYTFEADEEYVAIKELEHITRSETNIDARYAYRELFCKIDDGWLITRAMDEMKGVRRKRSELNDQN